eukprot:COSAG02_NODE_61625_length_268_cov_0.609467_1_plen_89_part_11
MGWQGERCDQDVNECQAGTYDHRCESFGQCQMGMKGCSANGFAVEPPLSCSVPYWVDPATKLPSGCDRNPGGPRNLLTKCQNLPGTWDC